MIYQTVLFFADAAAQPQQSPLGMLIPFICIGIIFYFLIIRPQSRKQKEHTALLSSMKSGDKIVTSGGIHGLVLNIKEATVIVKIADNVKIEVDKSAVAVVSKRSEETASEA
jgi:preprotein translocase subunit YajC